MFSITNIYLSTLLTSPTAPVWEQLGAKLKKSHPSVTVAKIDLTANDVDIQGAKVDSFPTIMFFKRGQKEQPIVYSGSRDLTALERFVEANNVVFSFKSTEL